jgi:hypothetical protein
MSTQASAGKTSSRMMMSPDEAVTEARRKARAFFDTIPSNATEQGTIDALAKVLLDENSTVMRDAADGFARAVIFVFTQEGKHDEGLEFLKKIHAVLTGR